MTTEGATVLNCQLEGPEDAPVPVLSNSLGTALERWDAQASALRGRFRLPRYDTRGHGRSPAPPGPYVVSAAEDPATLPEHGELVRDAIPGALRGRPQRLPHRQRGAT